MLRHTGKVHFALRNAAQYYMMELEIYGIAGEACQLSIREAFITMCTEAPLNWLKWAVVLEALTGSDATALPLYKKFRTA